jgi:hypothetical protein
MEQIPISTRAASCTCRVSDPRPAPRCCTRTRRVRVLTQWTLSPTPTVHPGTGTGTGTGTGSASGAGSGTGTGTELVSSLSLSLSLSLTSRRVALRSAVMHSEDITDHDHLSSLLVAREALCESDAETADVRLLSHFAAEHRELCGSHILWFSSCGSPARPVSSLVPSLSYSLPWPHSLPSYPLPFVALLSPFLDCSQRFAPNATLSTLCRVALCSPRRALRSLPYPSAPRSPTVPHHAPLNHQPRSSPAPFRTVSR